MNDAGSGGLVNNKEKPVKPAVKADKPAGEWNIFRIKATGNVVTIHLNDQLVVDKAVMENAFDSSRKLPVTEKSNSKRPARLNSEKYWSSPRILAPEPAFRGGDFKGIGTEAPS